MCGDQLQLSCLRNNLCCRLLVPACSGHTRGSSDPDSPHLPGTPSLVGGVGHDKAVALTRAVKRETLVLWGATGALDLAWRVREDFSGRGHLPQDLKERMEAIGLGWEECSGGGNNTCRLRILQGTQAFNLIGHMCVHAKSFQLCSILCNPMDHSLPGSSVYGILQARIPEWVAIPFSRESSKPRDQTRVSCIADKFFIVWATRKACREA